MLNEKTFARQGLSQPVPHDIVRRIDDACVRRACRTIVGARDGEGTLYAAVYIVKDGDTAYYLMGGSDPTLRQSGASQLAMWEGIKDAGRSVRRFDFLGSMIKPIEHAFRGFGARQFSYTAIQSDDHEQWIDSKTLLRMLGKRLTQRLWQSSRNRGGTP